ncbi:STAS domain-containing protein [Brassicibacter mesophilus]|jgi:anti-sigma B factor antagonist|uniref:STAS domain-containing protein n=1 Tax=Brassicibacter mesophilus TaxID=745119 RepID=UPI003D1EF768
MSLEVFKKFDDNTNSWIVEPIGEVDIYTSPAFKEALLQIMEERAVDIIINGENLVYIDSTGLGVLISVLKKARENNNEITITNIKPNIKKLFDLTSLDKVFTIKE